MLFNSITFLIFLVIVFTLYWSIKNIKRQNILLLISSYFFYGWWDWRFLSLIIISSAADYTISLFLNNEKNKRKRDLLLSLSIIINIGLLGFFKYYNFFVDSFINAFSFLGNTLNLRTLNIILPVGISFYTFQTLSYTIDIYKRKLEPTKDVIAFFAFVSFFPQLVAGPIERGKNLLPQFERKRIFKYENGIYGLKLIIWGLFKKMVIADNCAKVVDEVFNNYSNQDSLSLIIGVIYFAFQIYGDFSGYSDIAIGTARLFDFKLMRNFAYPYFSRDIAEFWRRWHISLSSWFRDYVYIPLGGSRVNTWLIIRNTFIIFIVSGFWHGANWTFIVWGGLNAIYFLPLQLLKKNRKNLTIIGKENNHISFNDVLNICITFILVCIGWIFFRSQSVTDALHYIEDIAAINLNFVNYTYLAFIPYIILMLVFEWINREKECPIDLKFRNNIYKYAFYTSFIVLIVFFSAEAKNSFIYFQF